MHPNPIEMVCQELVELVSDYLNHTLPAVQRTRFEEHLFTCPPCTSYLAQMKTTIQLAGEIGEPPQAPPIARVEQELVSLFRRWHQK